MIDIVWISPWSLVSALVLMMSCARWCSDKLDVQIKATQERQAKESWNHKVQVIRSCVEDARLDERMYVLTYIASRLSKLDRNDAGHEDCECTRAVRECLEELRIRGALDPDPQLLKELKQAADAFGKEHGEGAQLSIES